MRGRSDRELTTLLTLRPDLALPAPADLGALAARLAVRTSVQRAVDGLDAYTLRALENLVVAADAEGAISEPPEAGLADLLDRTLVWGDASLVHLVPGVREAVGIYPAGLGRPAALLFPQVPDALLAPVLRHFDLSPAAQPHGGTAAAAVLRDPQRLAGELAEVDDEEQEVLRRLAAGPPVGSVRATRLSPEAAQSSAPHRLLARGLLIPLDGQRIELPREVGIAVRGSVAGPAPEPPELAVAERAADELDQLGATTVLEFLRLVEAAADHWSAHSPAMLRSGGLGVRELRRLAKELDLDEPAAAALIEIAFAAGLVNATTGMEPSFLPTEEFDAWRERDVPHRWTVVAQAWLGMTRQPGLVGSRGDRDRVVNALGPDAERGTAPALRRDVLDLLAELPPGSAPTRREQVLDRLAWQQPRRAAGRRPLAEAVLAEADLLGVTAAGGLTGYSRTLLAASTPGAASTIGAARDALRHALPEPVDHFLVQPDLTVVVPGPPEPALGTELALIADLESTGGASVYRITERSVRRALDAGRSGQDLAAFVTARSRTPVPQGLRYLIDDAARRHGVLRAGTAGSYLRCDDESLLARVVADRSTAPLGLRQLAPTVVVADAGVSELLEALREAGYAPAAESAGGDLITLGVEPPRAPPRPPARAVAGRGAAAPGAAVAELVRRIRAGEALTTSDQRARAVSAQVPGVTSAATMEQLRTAVREARLVWFGCAEADGTTSSHTLQPISLAAGTLRGYERGRQGLASYPVHRITSIRVLEDAEDPDSDRGRPDAEER